MAATDKHSAELMELTAALAVVSAACGIGLSMWSEHSRQAAPLFWLLGVAHGIAFIPLTLRIGYGTIRKYVASVLCLSWPLWGFGLLMMTTGIFAPLVSSLIWGVVIAWVWKRPWAILILAIAGGLSIVSMFVLDALRVPWRSDYMIPEGIAAWYVLMVPALLITVWTKPMGASEPVSGAVCQECAYPLVGLENAIRCPECGSPTNVCPECGRNQSVVREPL
jgi:hypothetical protein